MLFFPGLLALFLAWLSFLIGVYTELSLFEEGCGWEGYWMLTDSSKLFIGIDWYIESELGEKMGIMFVGGSFLAAFGVLFIVFVSFIVAKDKL